jgi:hypothetical protein
VPQGLNEDVGGQREQESELIAEEARGAQPVQRQAGLELFDAVLHVAPRTVDLVDILIGVMDLMSKS